jgi:hypothetical protein
VRVYIPFTNLKAETFYALESVFPVLVPLLNPTDYSKFFIKQWKKGVSFIVVEHDVVVTPEQIESLITCPQPWCGYSYRAHDHNPYFGCVRFREDFIQRHKDLWVERPWGNCDVFLANHATIPYHPHGHVGHLH